METSFDEEDLMKRQKHPEEMPLYFPRSNATTESNKTGSWRYFRPSYAVLKKCRYIFRAPMPPPKATKPAPGDISDRRMQKKRPRAARHVRLVKISRE
jgi:hypothetical protein